MYTNIQPVVKWDGCIVYTAGFQTSCKTQFDNRLNEQWLFVQHSWTNSGCSFNTIVKPVIQPVVSCKRGITVARISLQPQRKTFLLVVLFFIFFYFLPQIFRRPWADFCETATGHTMSWNIFISYRGVHTSPLKDLRGKNPIFADLWIQGKQFQWRHSIAPLRSVVSLGYGVGQVNFESI